MTTTPDTRPPPPGAISISDLARRRGVAKQSLSEQVARLEARGLLRTWPGGRGRPKLVDPEELDRATALPPSAGGVGIGHALETTLEAYIALAQRTLAEVRALRQRQADETTP